MTDPADELDSIRQFRDCIDSYRDEDPERAARADAHADLLTRLVNLPWDPSPLARLIRLCDSLRMAAIASDPEVCADLDDELLENLIDTTIAWAMDAIAKAKKEANHD